MATKRRPKRQLSVPDRHLLKIARDTLRMPDAMVGVMGGPDKAESRRIIQRLSKRNPLSLGLPKNKWVNARVMVTSGGKIKAQVSENVLGGVKGLLGLGSRGRRSSKRNPMYGTSHFVSRSAAERYYRPYGYDDVKETVRRKIAEGEISIGRPTLKPGQRLTTVDGGKRYAIIEA